MCTWEEVSLESSYLEVIWSFGSHLVILQNYSVLFFLSFSFFLVFIYFWLPWVLVVVCGLSLVVESGGYSLVVLHGLHIVVASLVVELGLLGIWSSVVAAWEKAMAIHSSTLALKIPWMEESRRLQSMGSLRVGHN